MLFKRWALQRSAAPRLTLGIVPCAVAAQKQRYGRIPLLAQTEVLPVSLFHTILSKIFPSGHPAVAQNAPQAPKAPSAPSSQGAGAGTAATASSTPAAPAPSNTPAVDVEAVLNGLAQKNSEKLTGGPRSWI